MNKTEKQFDPKYEMVSKNDANSAENSSDSQVTGIEKTEIPIEKKDGLSSHSNRPMWFSFLVQPLMFLVCGILIIVVLGVAQKYGFITSGGGSPASSVSADPGTKYICPMMCTPPISEPGLCPVCGMELKPMKSGGGSSDFRSVRIDPASRRIANIKTASAKSQVISRTIQTIGRISYDEGTVKTISAYVDGRVEKLYADYTGVVVKKNDRLALFYSPRLYSSQVELLLAKRARDNSKTSTILRVAKSNQELLNSARQRLIELGMTQDQITELETSGEANSRMHLLAPISGTVIEKDVIEGQYAKEGDPIYKLADLSRIWLMLELFPKDAAAVRYGQRVESTVQSYPGHKFVGRVAFIDPEVDPQTRTIGVRVVIPNEKGLLKIGDFSNATVSVPISANGGSIAKIYDIDLVNKWISPRHPHIIRDEPGDCPICGMQLVPSSQYGYTNSPTKENESLIIPRNAVLMAGKYSVVYVETEPGRFEIRPVTLGPCTGDNIVILSGIKVGEEVATKGNFLIDSQMQLVANPSLIDPTRAMEPREPKEFTSKAIKALAKLSDEDQLLAKSQRVCPVLGFMLGSMGTPPKINVNGTDVFICCEGCKEQLLDDPETYLAILKRNSTENEKPSLPSQSTKIQKALSQLSKEDYDLAVKQGICPVAEMELGSMGTPIKIDIRGTPVFICCKGCEESLLESPEGYLEGLKNYAKNQNNKNSDAIIPELEIPTIEIPELELPTLIEPIKEIQQDDEASQTEGKK
ncbi:MAG: efflux RND transporter periplasmic adaptor subunit [Planctomycetaceae bacterium]|nr:efflux RND transporter periplasmic adaptor subunit [Planctomycetaceae bacterium]